MRIKAQVAMVMNLDKCIGCHTCSVTCKNTWTNRPGTEYMWYNNVETRPGPGYPREWEDLRKFKGGWVLRNGKLALRAGGPITKLANIFYNPNMASLDSFYEPWTYDYDSLIHSPKRKHLPVGRPVSLITGEYMDKPEWGPNWDDDLAGGSEIVPLDPNVKKLQEHIAMEYEKTFMMYLPRICEHCLNPSCVASCPSGALYKREEDGIVLVDQDACRGWRFCTNGCPYHKVYYNWNTHKAEKCNFCYPRTEAGLATICSETCVGRIRYIGVVFYDADRVKAAASVENPQDLYESQLSVFLDPFEPEVIKEARRNGINDSWIDAAQRSPIYKLAMKWKVALPLHPEYRTLPMVWYVPPLSPIMNHIEEDELQTDHYIPAVDQMRIPMEYLASLLTAGDISVIRRVLLKMTVMRVHMRERAVGGMDDLRHSQLLEEAGITVEEIEEMTRLFAVAKYNERFVIPTARREMDGEQELHYKQGACSIESITPSSAVMSHLFAREDHG
ncbi:nitrate reductase beta chain NarH [Paenibacillus larvae subsp. larvae]|uniref:Nitrate reductase subunit beta n=2 Tax=Paenibacillus larvae TaxID=1464 RepID=A0A1V0UWL6_9BACL|nr:nitrate reductase subunit beta [Paenibacillus larvae]AQZ47827.1 nitrate reductase subunit beta [Paenibacillus larvae subsp. pulvifaciens]ARF69587.1 nitrate reductase subunit beta [Paenibacillus larvae subsp. pulvifaciens]AVF25715.1 nitrate reductase beta chain NarH [Paenibacillus larvae subsp. larvae]AVF30492.1 nitrate reductase beta chain NarH [Paenibacillus larvae subsp. larvae]MBH0341917.1 nitrate reductase [Paenibacillus larvae]